MLLASGTVKYFGPTTIDALAIALPRLQDERQLARRNVADLLIDYIDEFQWSAANTQNNGINNHNNNRSNNQNNYQINNNYQSLNTNNEGPLQPRNIPSFPVQLYHLTKRAMAQFTRDTRTLLILYSLVIISALLIGVLYHKSEFVGQPSVDTISKCPTGFQFLCSQNQKDSYMAQVLLICLGMYKFCCHYYMSLL